MGRCIDCGTGLPVRAERRGRVSPRCLRCRKLRRQKVQRDRWHDKWADRRRARIGAKKRVRRHAPRPNLVGVPLPPPRADECAACGAETRLYKHDGDKVCIRCWHRWRTA